MERVWVSETPNFLNKEVECCGWVDSRRDHGKIIFVDLRDKTGKVQIVFLPENKEVHQIAEKLRSEWVIRIKGKVQKRPSGMENEKYLTGNIEIVAQEIEIFSEAQVLPFSIDTLGKELKEELRLKYRYLDLRRERMRKNIFHRFKAIKFIRDYLEKEGFIEIETPYLTKSTPEGARDYLVPSRLEPGKFYALPQSPQQYKQLLMVAGFERYFQIARCFRDEDTRGDRQPEFTQLDLEMDFVETEDILKLIENLIKELVEKFYPHKRIKEFPFPRIPYQEAIEKYQSDKPDLRDNKNDPNELAFLYVVDFPLFEWKESEKRWDSTHHPFTQPKREKGETQEELIKRIFQEPQNVFANQYDLVLNGYEVGGGSLRIHQPQLLEAIFRFLGHPPEKIRSQFGHLLEAFSYGVPPHGGIALGLDRLLMIFEDENTIREVIAFPKTGDGRDLMMNAPSEVEEKQLKELHLKIIK